jgi:hypothetical protein
MTVEAGKCLAKGLDTADIGLPLLHPSANECISGIHERMVGRGEHDRNYWFF